MERQNVVIALATLIDIYTSITSLVYKDMLKEISLMLLTSMDL